MSTTSQPPAAPADQTDAPGPSPLDRLVREIGAHALDSVGDQRDAATLETVGSLTDPSNQLAVVRALGRGILAADVAAVHHTEAALVNRSNQDRVAIISALGAHSATAAQQVEASLEPLIKRATRQTHVAADLIESTRATVADRHSDRQFVYWVSNDPDGFCRFVWSASLHAAGGRVWDRNWNRLLAQADALTQGRRSRTSSETLERASLIARDAAIRSLVESALSDDPQARKQAWSLALEHAEDMPGTIAWTRHAQTLRADLGAITWATSNSLIADHVAVIINELPWIAGFVGMIALAAEAAGAAARTASVVAGAQAMTPLADLDEALAAAKATAGGAALAQSA